MSGSVDTAWDYLNASVSVSTEPGKCPQAAATAAGRAHDVRDHQALLQS